MNISEKSENAIKEFLVQWWEDLSWQAYETVVNAQLPLQTPEQLYDQLLGHTLRQIAMAAEGLLPDDDDLRGEVYEACQQICEWMWARPGMPAAYHIPWEEWAATPIGNLVLRALVWAQRDELLTITQAARMTGRTVAAVSELVAKGRIQGYRDPDEPNPQRATRVRRSEVETLPPPRQYSA